MDRSELVHEIDCKKESTTSCYVQSVDDDWPLYVLDNDGGEHRVMMKPGDMVWYESARVIHGRPQPLQGEFFDNLFIHYR